MLYTEKRVRKQIISVTTTGLVSFGILFSCSKKNDPQPDSSASSSGTTNTTTSGTTTGGTTNTLTVNTWQVIKGSTVTTYTALNKSIQTHSGSVVYYFADNASPPNNMFIHIGGATTLSNTPSGTYTLVAYNSSTVPGPNQVMINSSGFGAYKSIAASGSIMVSNTSGTLAVMGANLTMADFIQPTNTLVVSANLRY